NWTAMQGNIAARYKGGKPMQARPQQRSFWAPPQQTSESALLTRWNGQLYVVIGDEAQDGRWQLRLWWKPFVTLIWFGGILIALGGWLAWLGRVAADLRRAYARGRIAQRREGMSRCARLMQRRRAAALHCGRSGCRCSCSRPSWRW